ncbi:zinc finger protein OZF-like isoform X2 [Leguminivora glycinivorella]|uniref:zinc finger protein OZF-like isoform X2 n=1 Tax=Leguminivora glycinivorella TaxID=1035111 RepID=UPI00200D105C|nr:zinc finger protein OZF-like isoform X2 [Leguminivora glycinivorella]
MESINQCHCCLQRPPAKDLRTPYTRHGITEIYSLMIEECFVIKLASSNEEQSGICGECLRLLREASSFKMQVQRCQAELRQRLQAALRAKASDEENPGPSWKEEPPDEYLTHPDEESPAPPFKEEPRDEYLSLGEYEVDRAPLPSRAVQQLSLGCSVKVERLSDSPLASQPCHVTSHRESDEQAYTHDTRPTHDSSLNTHKQENITPVTNTEVYCCDMCAHLCTSKLTLIRHIRTHTHPEGRHNTCEVNHEKINSRIKGYKCKKCNKEFTFKKSLVAHDRIHTGMMPYKCKVCDKEFTCKWFLVRHERSHSGIKPYKCNECNKEFAQKFNLVTHKKNHNGIKPYKCRECNKEFIMKRSLTDHEKIHSGIKPYKCKVCYKEFTLEKRLGYHVKTHSGIKPFKCKECNKEFTVKVSLVRHERIHSGIKPYECKECKKEFRQKTHLNIHERIHSGIKPYKCEECHKEFNQNSNLVAHKKIHRGI